MKDVDMSDKFIVYQPDGDDCGDFVAFNGAYGESILNESECVKMLNGFNNTCDKLTEQNKMLREALNEIRDQPLSAPEIDDLIDKVLEATKC